MEIGSSNDLLKNCFSGSTRGFFSPFRRILSMLSYHCFFVWQIANQFNFLLLRTGVKNRQSIYFSFLGLSD